MLVLCKNTLRLKTLISFSASTSLVPFFPYCKLSALHELMLAASCPIQTYMDLTLKITPFRIVWNPRQYFTNTSWTDPSVFIEGNEAIRK